MSEAQLAARFAIINAVANWALWRDTGRWDKLRGLYTADAIQHTTWFVGPAREFIERVAARPLGGSQHFVGACAVELDADRAIAETRLVLLVRGRLQDIDVDVTCYARSYDRFVRVAQQWRIQQRQMIYEKDRIDAVDPGVRLALDRAALARHPVGYRHLAYLQTEIGYMVKPDMPGLKGPEVQALYARGNGWLAGKGL